MTDVIIEKVARLEERQNAIVENISEMKDIQSETLEELKGLRDDVARGKGAWWALTLVLGAGGLGGAASTLVHKLLP